MVEEEGTVVQAVGTVAGAGSGSITPEEIEQAMAAAVLKAMDEGVTDPEEIRRRQLEARDKVVKAHESPGDVPAGA